MAGVGAGSRRQTAAGAKSRASTRAKSRVLTRQPGKGRGSERRPVVTMGHGREVTAGQEGGGADPRLEVDDYPFSSERDA
jgi:hypothetical protein